MIIIFSVVVILVFFLYRLNQDTCSYWSARGVPYVPATPLFDKNILKSLLPTPENLGKIYKSAEGKDYVGFFLLRTPVLMVCNPEIINGVLRQDFQKFSANRKPECVREDDPLSQHLLALQGEKWKNLRSKIIPVFTSGKLKSMYYLINERVEEFLRVLDQYEGKPIDAEKFCSQISISSIVSCAFGLDTKCMDPANDRFLKIGRSAFEAGFWKMLKVQLKMFHPAIFNFLRLTGYSKDSSDFCANFIKDVIAHRRASGYTRSDYVDILMKIQKELSERPGQDNGLSDSLIAAQVFSFLVAGYETTTTTLCCALYELAKHPQIVEQVRAEVLESLGTSGCFNYETLMRMELLERVIKETLRKHPPVVFLPRICTETTYLPGTEVMIEKGTQLLIPVLNLHHDPIYVPQPDEFMPERFSNQKQFALPNVPYMPFSDGPRKCIGMRFAMLELKASLANIILEFDLKLDESTEKKHLTLEEFSRTYKIKDKINIVFTNRNKYRVKDKTKEFV